MRVVLTYCLVQIQIQHQSKGLQNYLYLQPSRNSSFSTVCRCISTNFFSVAHIFNMSVSTWVHFSMCTMPHTVASEHQNIFMNFCDLIYMTCQWKYNQWENTCHSSGKLLSILIISFISFLLPSWNIFAHHHIQWVRHCEELEKHDEEIERKRFQA